MRIPVAGGQIGKLLRSTTEYIPLYFLLLGIVVCIAVFVGDSTAHGAKNKDDVQEEIRAGRSRIDTLSAEERRVHRDMARAEDQIRSLEKQLRSSQAELNSVIGQEKGIRRKLSNLEAERDQAKKDLYELLGGLWPVYLNYVMFRGEGLPTWGKADREFVWLGRVYEVAREKLETVDRTDEDIRLAAADKKQISRELQRKLASVNSRKNELLADKQKFSDRLVAIRKRKEDTEERIRRLLQIVEELQYDVSYAKPVQDKEPITSMKGKLPWPVTGKVIAPFETDGSEPNRGLGIDAPEHAVVRAVYSGKVVHDAVLRGFGRVVIIVHEGDYYSLYAYLSSSKVKVGDDVSRNTPIGTAGYYPKAKGTGLYFELRFRQKPINPFGWLSAQK